MALSEFDMEGGLKVIIPFDSNAIYSVTVISAIFGYGKVSVSKYSVTTLRS